MIWFVFDYDTYKHAIFEIDKQRDRGAGIIAASILQDHLLHAIKSRLQRNPSLEASLFKMSGPIGSFATQIDLGLLLGIYPNHIRERLHIIRLIRNDFAHNVQPASFRSQRDRCAKLRTSKRSRGMQPFQKNLDDILKSGDHGFDIRSDLFEVSNNPRTQYIRAVQQITLFLTIMSQVAVGPQAWIEKSNGDFRFARSSLPRKSGARPPVRIAGLGRKRKVARRPPQLSRV